MSLLSEIRAAIMVYMDVHGGRPPNVIYLSRGMVGILRNELTIPDGVTLKTVLGMEIRRQPSMLVGYETVD